MEYSIHKDEHPRQTVKKIKDILKNLDINPKETIVHFNYTKKNAPRSLRVYINNNYLLGTNGKGSNYINSRASGYAELMERLQNSLIINFKNSQDSLLPDEKYYTNEELLNSEISQYFPNKNSLRLLNKYLNDKNKIVMSPWYSIKKQKEVFLPQNIIFFYQSSNGMAAGNNLVEATIQGLSEICERYALKRIIYDKIATPEIPKNEYMQYEKIKGMVEYVESLGFKITIKDASLGENLPVVLATIIDSKNKKLFFKLGSHPIFPIAVERVLTEFFQGISVEISGENNFKHTVHITNALQKYEQTIYDFFTTKNVNINLDSDIANLFLNNTANYQYNNQTFLDEKNNNEQILKHLLNILKPITNNEIYIRNESFLGFPSVYIYIPSMSFIRRINKENELEKLIEIQDVFISNIKEQDEIKTEKMLKMINDGICKFEYCIFKQLFTKNTKLKNSKFYMIKFLFLYSILKKDKKMINLYLDLFKYFKDIFTEKQILFNNIIEDYFKIDSDEKNKNIIIKTLTEKYKEDDVKYVFKFLDNLSLKIITKLMYIGIEKSNKLSVDEGEEKIRNTLIQAYKNNIPNQNKIKSML